MCGLFGFSICGDNKKDFSKLINELAKGASERGTHATGIAYNSGDKLTIYKKPLPASKMSFKCSPDIKVVTGHTRHATQGDCQINRNNHPFRGILKDTEIALAHNGIIYNDHTLQRDEKLPDSKIKTDSYIMVQLLEKAKKLNFDTIKECTEKLQGYYTFTLLDKENNLYIIKGDSPISIIKIHKYNMFVYASTDAILYHALIDAGLLDEIVKGRFDIIQISDGDIMKIDNNGKITKGTYTPFDYSNYHFKNWYDFDYEYSYTGNYTQDEYLDSLRNMASLFGYTADDVDALVYDGFTLDEIEDFLYTGEI